MDKKAKRTFPYGRTRQDTVAQPFTSRRMAELFATIMERVTGDDYLVDRRGYSWFIVLRFTEEGKRVRA